MVQVKEVTAVVGSDEFKIQVRDKLRQFFKDTDYTAIEIAKGVGLSRTTIALYNTSEQQQMSTESAIKINEYINLLAELEKVKEVARENLATRPYEPLDFVQIVYDIQVKEQQK